MSIYVFCECVCFGSLFLPPHCDSHTLLSRTPYVKVVYRLVYRVPEDLRQVHSLIGYLVNSMYRIENPQLYFAG